MSRRIRPAEEEVGNIIPTILFMFLWYSGLLGIIASTGFDTMLLLFLVAGLIPLYSVVTSIRRALFYRRQRAEAIAGGQSCTGKIRSVVRQDQPYLDHTHDHRRIRYRRYYYLEVDMINPDTGVTNTIRSQGYSKPIHRYLSSNKVRVYTDKSGWKYYLEDFQWKQHKNDPDIFDYPKEFEDTIMGQGNIIQIIFIVIMILMVLNTFFQIG